MPRHTTESITTRCLIESNVPSIRYRQVIGSSTDWVLPYVRHQHLCTAFLVVCTVKDNHNEKVFF